jgi:hypothetical protein
VVVPREPDDELGPYGVGAEQVEVRSRPPQLFVVSKLDDVIERIESARPGGGA